AAAGTHGHRRQLGSIEERAHVRNLPHQRRSGALLGGFAYLGWGRFTDDGVVGTRMALQNLRPYGLDEEQDRVDVGGGLEVASTYHHVRIPRLAGYAGVIGIDVDAVVRHHDAACYVG